MKSATVTEIKKELNDKSPKELIELCLSLSKFKKENKELLTYLLFEADNEAGYVAAIKEEIDLLFTEINLSSYYFVKKSVRKILRLIKKYIRYSKKKETETELLLHFCQKLGDLDPYIEHNTVLINIYYKQIEIAQKAVNTLHEDLQYDYNREIAALSSNDNGIE